MKQHNVGRGLLVPIIYCQEDLEYHRRVTMSEIGNVEVTSGGVKRVLVYENDTGLKVYEMLAYSNGPESATQVSPGHHYMSEAPKAENAETYPMFWMTNFQDGPIPANGVNGVTNESMIAVLIHRTETLNASFPCVENELALTHLRQALAAFDKRTANRKARGVEGQNKV